MQRSTIQSSEFYRDPKFLETIQLKKGMYHEDYYGRLDLNLRADTKTLFIGVGNQLRNINDHIDYIARYNIQVSSQVSKALEERRAFLEKALNVFMSDDGRNAYDTERTRKIHEIRDAQIKITERQANNKRREVSNLFRAHLEAFRDVLPLQNENFQKFLSDILPVANTSGGNNQAFASAVSDLNIPALRALHDAAKNAIKEIDKSPGYKNQAEYQSLKKNLDYLSGIAERKLIQKRAVASNLPIQFDPLKKEIEKLLSLKKGSTSGEKRKAIEGLEAEFVKVKADIQLGNVSSLTEIKNRLVSKIDDVAFYSIEQQKKKTTFFSSKVGDKATDILNKHFASLPPSVHTSATRTEADEKLRNGEAIIASDNRKYKNSAFINLRNSTSSQSEIAVDVIQTDANGRIRNVKIEGEGVKSHFRTRYAYVHGAWVNSAKFDVQSTEKIDQEWIRNHPQEMQKLLQEVMRHEKMHASVKDFRVVVDPASYTSAPILTPKEEKPSLRHAPAFHSQG